MPIQHAQSQALLLQLNLIRKIVKGYPKILIKIKLKLATFLLIAGKCVISISSIYEICRIMPLATCTALN